MADVGDDYAYDASDLPEYPAPLKVRAPSYDPPPKTNPWFIALMILLPIWFAIGVFVAGYQVGAAHG